MSPDGYLQAVRSVASASAVCRQATSGGASRFAHDNAIVVVAPFSRLLNAHEDSHVDYEVRASGPCVATCRELHGRRVLAIEGWSLEVKRKVWRTQIHFEFGGMEP